MGGKSKNTDRTKDKARPSSSSHCAELLGNSIPIFVDFSTAKESIFGTSREPSCNVDTNFQLVLKKMMKKDSVTKLKALQEFKNLCQESDNETVKSILPYWPRLYCALATDVEHRVREAAHIAHAAIVEKVKKSLAPYLKQLAGPWFTSQYDNYPPAASAATSAFEQAFPPEKQNKVLMFCQEEVLNYIYESLITHTPHTLSNPKITNQEEMNAKYQRIVIASLQGYNLYLQKMTPEQIKEAQESNKKIVSSPKFWEYSKNKIPVIRCSFFKVLISLCQNGKFLLSTEMKKVTAAIFSNLDDSDPMVMTSVWDAALNALVFLEDTWSYINFEKQVFPKLNVVIRKGGRNAITIFPSILPLLSRVPSDLIKDKADFYGTLLQNIRRVMEGPTVINPSSSDGRTIAMTFMECLKYIINQHNSDESLCNGLVKEHLISALDKFLSTPKSTNSSTMTAFFTETSKALRSWYSSLSSKKEPYNNILQLFWDSLLKIYGKHLEFQTSHTVIGDLLNNQLEFLTILQNPKKYAEKPRRKLHFEEDTWSSAEVAGGMDDPVDHVEDAPEFHEELLKFVKSIAGTYLRNSVMIQDSLYIPILGQIVNLFDSKMIFEEFLMVQNESNLYSLFCNVFSKWLENDCLRRGELVHLSFSLLQYLRKEEKDLILEKFCEDWPTSDLQYDICRSLLHYYNDDSVKSWISSEKFSNHFLELTKGFVTSNNGSEKSHDIIISFLKTKDANGEFILSAATASSIMDIISNSLLLYREKAHVRELAQNLIVKVDRKDTECENSCKKLVISLFKLSCYDGNDKNLAEACGFGLRKALAREGNDFVEKLADAIKEIVFGDGETFDLKSIISRIDYFVELSVGTRLSEGTASNVDVEKAVDIIKYFVKEPPMVTTWRKRLRKCCFIGYQSVGLLDLKFVDLMDKKPQGKSLADSQNIFDKLRSDFNDNSSNVIDGNLNDEYFSDVLMYYNLYKQNNSANKSQASKSDADFTPETMVKFAKWNIFVGSVVNLLVSAHPKRYKTSILLEDWNPYYIDEKELFEKNLDPDVLPIKVTKEELEELQLELKNVNENFCNSDYDRKINVFSICGEIFDFTFSVGLLVSFCQYYAGTKYFPILQKYTKETRAIGKELFMNANLVENFFFYRCCKYFASEVAEWRIIKPSLQELFHKKFPDDKTTLDSEYVREFIKSCIAQPAVGNNALLKLCYVTQDKVIYDIDEDGWNKIFICLHKFFENSTFQENISERDLTMLSLLSRITKKLMESFSVMRPRKPEEKLCPEACLAWNELVRKELEKEFFLLWQKLAEKWHNKTVSLESLIAVQNISEVIISGKAGIESSGIDKVKLAAEYIRYIQSPYTVFQITSFELLLRLVPELVRLDTETYCKNISKLTEDMKEGSVKTSKCNWTCQNLEDAMSSTQGIVETLLSDFVIGDCCSVEPFTDSFNYTFSYLLIWCFLLEMCGEADSTLRFQYGFWLRDKGFTNSLLESVFKLMPQTVIHGTEVKENCQKYFESYSSPSLKEPVNSERIERIACFVYRRFLQRLPNIIREWWSQSENKTSTLVDKVTSLYVSPILIANELKNVQQDRDGCFDNMEIKTHPIAREVIATYTIDEVKMDLIMTLPQNYPLGTIKIESSNMVVSSSSRRNWLFHISKYLIHQNGTIWEALIMWKNNLDKKFEGVEECYICASILQGSTFETPKTCCRICKKKFHSHCLYKWFSTSNNSSCPICRNLF